MKIIISIEKPTQSRKKEYEWRDILGETNALLKDGIEAVKLGEGSWQIESENGLPVFAYALHAAEAENLSYRVLFVESGTEWNRSF